MLRSFQASLKNSFKHSNVLNAVHMSFDKKYYEQIILVIIKVNVRACNLSNIYLIITCCVSHGMDISKYFKFPKIFNKNNNFLKNCKNKLLVGNLNLNSSLMTI